MKTEANLAHLKNEIINHVLSYLSYEQVDSLRLVNKKLHAACDHRLKEGYLKVKREVESCCDQLFRETNGKLVSYSPTGFGDFARKMFWFFVRQFLNNSFSLFDMFKGYLDVEYHVNGKTIDLVQRILWLKDSEDPLSHLVEMVIGRSVNNSNMKSYSDFGCSYSQWFNATKYLRGVDIPSLYVPLLKKSDYKLMRTNLHDSTTNLSSAMMLELLSTLWTGKAHLDEHLVWDSTRVKYGRMMHLKLIPALKPGEDEDPQLYIELLTNSDEEEYDAELDIIEKYPVRGKCKL